MKIGKALGIFSNINSDDYTNKEKAEAIYLVMQKNRAHDVRKDAMNDVIRWLWHRCFKITRNGKEV